MLRKLYIPICISLTLIVACTPTTPPPTPTPTFTPSPTPTATPAPTATPIPPLALTIHWPRRASALQPVPIEVELVPPPGVSVTATVNTSVLGPEGLPWWTFDLLPREGNLYVAGETLQFPLRPPEGDWRLVVYVQSTLEVEGRRELVFRPAPIRFRDLTDALPAGVDVRVPQDFAQVVAQGDRWAGGRVWRYGGGELALWWAPGPVEPLLLNNAVVMLETTHDPETPPHVLDVEEMEWQGQTAFLFREQWLGAEEEKRPAEALVVQGPDYWLYVLRVRAVGSESDVIPPLLRQVWGTLAFIEE